MHLSFANELGLGTLWAPPLLAIALVLAVAVLYRGAFHQDADRRRWVLIGLRSSALILILLLLTRPLLSLESVETTRAELLLLLDNSASMSVRDDLAGRTRWERVQEELVDTGPAISENFRLRSFRFAGDVSLLRNLGEAGKLQPTGPRTDLVTAVRAATQIAGRDKAQGVVLVTDGVDNTGGELTVLEDLTRLGLPIHTVVVGRSVAEGSGGGDIILRTVECPDQLSLDAQATVIAYVDARNLSGRVVPVELLEGETVLAQASLTLDSQEGVQRVELPFVPEVEGRHEYAVRIPKATGELVDINNEQEFSALVVEKRLRVLYVEGGVRAEYGALVGQVLAHDPSLEYLGIVQTRPGFFVQRSNIPGLESQGIPKDPEFLKTFDVFVLGDIHSKFLGAETLTRIAELVRGGKGLLMLGGRASYAGGGYGDTPLADVLPVDVSQEHEQIDEAFALSLTSSGQVHPIFRGIVDYFGSGVNGQTVPPLLGCVALDRAKPSAEVLAVHPERGGPEGPLPILAVHRFGEGRAAAFAADTTHRWYLMLRSLGEDSPFIKFWGQLLRWLGGKKDTDLREAGLSVETDKGSYRTGEPITIDALYVGEDGRAVNDAILYAAFQPEDALDDITPKLVDLTRRDDRPGSYTLTYTPDQPGTYRARVIVEVKGEIEREQTIRIRVGDPHEEFERLEPDATLLQNVASQTGGHFYPLARLDRLAEEVAREQRERRLLFEMPLYNNPLFWLLFLGLITAEWLLRKRYRLR